MSNNKPSKTELQAIYRLEFYKKKGDWKLSDTRQVLSTSLKTNKKALNETYCIETCNLQTNADRECLVNNNGLINNEEPVNTVIPDELNRWIETLQVSRTSEPEDDKDSRGLLQVCTCCDGEGESSFEEFLRGARLAPHSSELDLTAEDEADSSLTEWGAACCGGARAGRGRGRLAHKREYVVTIHWGRPRRV